MSKKQLSAKDKIREKVLHKVDEIDKKKIDEVLEEEGLISKRIAAQEVMNRLVRCKALAFNSTIGSFLVVVGMMVKPIVGYGVFALVFCIGAYLLGRNEQDIRYIQEKYGNA